MKFLGFNISKNAPIKVKDLSKIKEAAGIVRIRQNIKTWRESLKEAERTNYPSFGPLAKMYADTINNGHVWSCYDKRKSMVLEKGYGMYDKNGNLDEVATEIIKKPWFTTILNYVLDAEAFGPTLFSFGDILNDDISEIILKPRHLINPWKKEILPYENMPYGDKTEVPELKDWFVWVLSPSELGNIPFGVGYLYRVAFLEIFLRNGYSLNADYNEIFGSPLRWGKTSSTDDAERKRLLDDLVSMGSSGAVVTGLDDVIEFVESGSRTTGTNTFENFEKRLEAVVSKIILGHGAAMDSTPSRLGGEDPAQEALKTTTSRSCSFAETVINSIVIPKLVSLGIVGLKGPKFSFDNKKQDQEERDFEADYVQKIVMAVKTLFDAGLEVDPKQIEEKTGYRVTKKIIEPQPTAPTNNDLGTNLAKMYAPEWLQVTHVHADNKAFGGFFEILERILNKIWGGFNYEAEKTELTNATFAELLKTLEALEDKETFERYRANLFQFSNAKTEATLMAMNDAFRQTANYSEFVKTVRQIDDTFNKAYLATEYGTANATVLNTISFIKGKLQKYARWVQIDRLTKRKEHKVLDGKVWKVEGIPFIPPIGFNCGCDLEYFMEWDGVVEDANSTYKYLQEKAPDLLANMKKYGFNRNPYVDGMIFDIKKIYDV